MSTMMIDGHPVALEVDAESGAIRGEFLDTNGVVEFYAERVGDLEVEGRASLEIYEQACRDDGKAPFEHHRGNFQVRATPELHRRVILASRLRGESMNSYVVKVLSASVDRDIDSSPPQ